MDYRTELLMVIDKYNIEVVEEFKEIENSIIADSKFRMITKKKDYDYHITRLRKLKNRARRTDYRNVTIPENDSVTGDLVKAFEKCMVAFNGVCDTYIQLESALKQKSEGIKLSFGDYRKINDKVKEAKVKYNETVHNMDIMYSELIDFVEDDKTEDFGGVEYKTYDSF